MARRSMAAGGSGILCAHPTRHQNRRKATHPKGKRVISKQFANYIQKYYRRGIGKSKLSIREGDFLCFKCYNFEFIKMSKKYKLTQVQESVVEHYPKLEPMEFVSFLNLTEAQSVIQDETLSSASPNSSNASMNEFYDKQEAVDSLNNVFELMNIERIVDVRHRDELRSKSNQVVVKLHNMHDSILDLKISSNSSNTHFLSSGVTLHDYQTLIDGLKQLFFISNKEQQLQLLTITPAEWGRKKIEYFFNCTEHQAKEAILLRYLYGVLARPTYFSGNKPLSKEIIDQVLEFYQDDRISRQSSNKKDKIKVNGEDKIFRFMDMCVGDAYLVFKNEFSNINISHSKFFALRPKWVKINCPSQGCLCIYHENFHLLLEAWNNRNDVDWDLQQLTDCILCTSTTESCYTEQCDDCGDRSPSDIMRLTCKGDIDDEDNEVRWFNWIRTSGKVSLQETSGSMATLLSKIDEQWAVILYHHHVKEQQKYFIHEIKQRSSDQDYVVITCDFAENYTLVAQREVQSAHWNQQQVAIFTIHVKIGDLHLNVAAISDYLNHDTVFVHCCQKTIVTMVKDKFPLVRKIVYVSDGAGMHFKNKYNMYNLSCHKEEFGIGAEWLFTATGHGKSACDGIGAALKCSATRHISQSQKKTFFSSAEDFYEFCRAHKSLSSKIDVFFIKNNYVLEQTYILNERWKKLPTKSWIVGIKGFHHFESPSTGHLICKITSTSSELHEFTLT
ncbi:unnamed protein product [Adineta ricciae]|uniref:Uncharacterized protein n=1 Tax=Adineta ricciae TaxID=249248 RepID=A0A815WM16_ADIRI|nr:unnamed protein product [Adineta ricciae]